MFKSILTALVLLLLLGPVASAADLKGRIGAINLEKRTIALKIGEENQTFDLADGCKVYKLAGRKGRPARSALFPCPCQNDNKHAWSILIASTTCW